MACSSLIAKVIFLFFCVMSSTSSLVTAKQGNRYLSVMLVWENVDYNEGLSDELQIIGIEEMASMLSEEMETIAIPNRIIPNVGATEYGHLSTIASIRLQKMDVSSSSTSSYSQAKQEATRRMLGLSPPSSNLKYSASSNNNIDINAHIDFLRGGNANTLLKQNIMNKLHSINARKQAERENSLGTDTNDGSGDIIDDDNNNDLNDVLMPHKRNLLGYKGKQRTAATSTPKLVSILVEEEIRFDLAIEEQVQDDKRREYKQESLDDDKKPHSEIHRITKKRDETSSVNNVKVEQKDAKLSRVFKPKFFANDISAQSKIKMSASNRWGLDRINQKTLPLDGNTGIPDMFHPPLTQAHVYVIDSTIRTDHDEFEGGVIMAWVINGDDPDEAGKNPCISHGTHVAGIIKGKTVGVNKEAKIYGMGAINCEGYAYTSDLIAANLAILEICVANGGKAVRGIVVNLSLNGAGNPNALGAGPYAYSFQQLIDQCDAVFVVAAGNSAIDACDTIPAGFISRFPESFIVAGASDINDNSAGFTNYGKCISMFGPGTNIISAGASGPNHYVSLSGTSMSAPYVTGVFSLLMTRRPTFWQSMFAFVNFGTNVINKMLQDATDSIKNLPNPQTTSRLLYLSPVPIPTTEVIPPTSYLIAPPSYVKRYTSGAGTLSDSIKIDTTIIFWISIVTIASIGIVVFL